MNFIAPSLHMDPREEELIEISSSPNPNPAATTGERENPNPAATIGEWDAEWRIGARRFAERRFAERRRIAERRIAERSRRIAEWRRFRLLNPNGEYSTVWSAVLILVCGFAVSVDPLFLYIPIVNIDIKCARLDRKLLVTALFLRFLTDIFYAYDIIWNVLEGYFNRWRIIKQWFLIVVLAVAPVPQAVILSFPRIIRLPGFFRMMVNSLVVLQYVIRVGRIYQLRKKLEKHITQDTPIKWFTGVGKLWISGAFIIFEFILAGHVFGALWYFFSFQRLMDCWKYACRNENGCEVGGFYCENKDTFMRNVTLLNNLCHANPPTATSFDFGIFLDAIQSGILSSTDFPQKFLHCFWWGLRNLSSFGQNLQTSSYAWEDLFAVLINVIGMLFVLIYLNAILQVTKLQNMKEKEFEAFCDYLKPVIHEADTFIIREGEQFDKMLFITQGTVRTYTTTSDDVCGSASAGNTLGDGCFQKGDFYGEELVQAWEFYEGTTSRSTKNVKCCTKVEGFTLTIKDMKRGIEKIRE